MDMKWQARPGAIPNRGRRQLLAASVGLALQPCAGRAQTPATIVSSESAVDKPPGGVRGKFYPTGQVREWPGNTIICPVEPDTTLHQALKAVQEAAMTEPAMRKFTLLPTSSLHMTLFEGVDLDHRRAPYWPGALPVDAPLAVANKWCEDKLRTFHTGGGHFRMRPDAGFSVPKIADFSIRLDPADAAQNTQLRALRDRLSALLQIRAPGHDRYRFHITLAYLIQWLTPDETDTVQQLFRRWLAQIGAATPEFVIGPPAFCTFRDMFAFTPVTTLKA
jgi:hypothetical protein